MHKAFGWLWIVGFFGLFVSADAQTHSSFTADTQFDGTYAFVSSTKLSETYRDRLDRMGQCTDRKAGPITIVNGQARYSDFGLKISREFEGTVGSQGKLTMRSNYVPGPTLDIIVSGKIDGNGTVTARQSGDLCSYDLVWQKDTK